MTDLAAAMLVHCWFERAARAHPERSAISAGSSTISFADLNARANRLARHLRGEHRIGPDHRVAILMDRSPELIVAVLATLKAGAAYVPLDLAYPSERLAYCIADSDPAIVLTNGNSRHSPSLSAHARYFDVRRNQRQLETYPTPDLDNDAVGLTAESIAYLMYTSGSTGRPKGVVVPHRAACNLFAAQRAYLGVEPASRILPVSSFSFDAWLFETFMALTNGATLCLEPADVLLVGDSLSNAIQRNAITHLTITPTVLETIPDAGDLRSLTVLIVAGEPLAGSSVRRWAPGRRVINAYGPTETTVCATWCECSATADDDPPIGKALPNVTVYVLDDELRECAIGEVGELFVGGVAVARGYWKQPQLTAERFLPDPFARVMDARVYRTGDLGCRLADGNIKFLGRNDTQIKIRGMRVELAEIEAQLQSLPGVRSARVVSRQHGELVAYYVAGGSLEPTASSLRDQLERHLPAHMLPVAYVRIDALPLTPNGKLDIGQLSPPGADAFISAPYAAPSGERETGVARIWTEVLERDRIGRYDDFFKIGGNSLLAAMVCARVRERLTSAVTLNDLFSQPRLCDFADVLGKAAPHPDDKVSLDARGKASFAQDRLWYVAQQAGASSAYHVTFGPMTWTRPSGLRLSGVLDDKALARAFDEVIDRHEAVRTTFAMVDGELLYRVQRAQPGSLQYRDISEDSDARSTLEQLKREQLSAPFDLEAGPLIRGLLVRVGELEHVLVVVMHHIAADGWSTTRFVRELEHLYRVHLGLAVDRLPPLALQYADYAARQRKSLTAQTVLRQRDYWKRQLAGAPTMLALPTDRRRPARQVFDGGVAELGLDEDLTRRLRQLSERRGTTLYMTLLAGWAVLMSRLSGQEDVIIGSPFSDRSRPELEGLIGLFINTIALRIDLADGPSVAELLARVKKCVLDAFSHSELPFEQVVEIVAPPRHLESTPVFQVMFAWHNYAVSDIAFTGVTVEPEPIAYDTSKFDLTLNLGEVDGRIVGGLEYASALFEPTTIARYVDYFRAVLTSMAADEEQRVTAIGLVSDAEQDQLLADAHVSTAPSPVGALVHGRFEAHAAAGPDRVAVMDEAGRSISYGELNGEANRLACELRRAGVGPDTRVAICVERSVEMIVGILAILKAGGCYVPLDPSYPTARLTHMVTHSRAGILLVHSRTPPELLAALSAAAPALRLLDLERGEQWRDESAENVDTGDNRVEPDHLAYVIYTSGSTGAPKGIAMPHSALVNLVDWQTSSGAAPTTLQFSALSFDVSFQEVFSALSSGALLQLVDKAARQDPRKLQAQIASAHISRLFLPYVALRMLAEATSDDSVLVLPSALREIIVAGEQLRITPAIRRLLQLVPDCRLYNHYGPTETHVVTAHALPRDIADELPPIGRAIPNARVYVLDRHRRLVPRGQIGDLYVGGVALARGYLDEPSLTAERFVPDAFAAPGSRMYRTGDTARLLPDGNLEFVGRSDFQIKIRGFRVEPGEIEARLEEHSDVKTAVVVVREDAGNRQLVAYYVADAPVPADVLRSHVSAVLPDYMVPAAYVQLVSLPLTPSGKLDRVALSSMPLPAQVQDEEPSGPVELCLAAMWAQILRLEHVGRNGHFFELGGHSLLATVLLARCRAEFGVDLVLADLFKAPVLTEFARVVVIAQLDRLEAARG